MQVVNLQAELAYLQAHLATLEVPNAPPPAAQQSQPQPPLFVPPPVLNIADLPTGVPMMPATYDLSSLFDPMVQPAWAIQPRQLDPRQLFGSAAATRVDMTSSSSSAAVSGGGGGGDLQELARELMHRHGSPTVPCTNAPSSAAPPPHSK
nr:LOB domain-containing protein 30-like [Ipomoea batatas]